MNFKKNPMNYSYTKWEKKPKTTTKLKSQDIIVKL